MINSNAENKSKNLENTTSKKQIAKAKLTNDTKKVANDSFDNKFDVSETPTLKKIAPETDTINAILVANTNNKTSVYNKDLSDKKNNIKAFLNSIDEEEEENNGRESINVKNSGNKQNPKEIVLLGKIEKNVPLRTGTVDVSAMKIKGNGNYVETGTASRTHALRINFKMYKNENISPGNKEVFIVIQNPKGTVINERGHFTHRSGKEIAYSDETVVFYDGNDLNISILSGKFIQRIVKGTYVVKVYIERYLTGQTLLILS